MGELDKPLSKEVHALGERFLDAVNFSVEVTEHTSKIQMGDGSPQDQLRMYESLGAKDICFGVGIGQPNCEPNRV